MGPAHEHTFDVPPSAIDANGHVNNVEYVRWMQDAAVRHFAVLGGTAPLAAAGATWVARSHHIEYLRPAHLGERLLVHTWIDSTRRVSSIRKYEFLRLPDRTPLARGETEWVLVDVTTGRPRSIPQDLLDLLKPAAP